MKNSWVLRSLFCYLHLYFVWNSKLDQIGSSVRKRYWWVEQWMDACIRLWSHLQIYFLCFLWNPKKLCHSTYMSSAWEQKVHTFPITWLLAYTSWRWEIWEGRVISTSYLISSQGSLGTFFMNPGWEETKRRWAMYCI